MKIEVDMSKVVPAASMEGEDQEETAELKELLKEATDYLKTFSWVRKIKATYFGLGFSNILGIFLFDIVHSKKGGDDKVWVIVGDLPPAYITAEDDSPNPATALDSYIGAMERWVAAAKIGGNVEDLIQVNVPPTPENAKLLESRLEFLDREILSHYAEDLAD